MAVGELHLGHRHGPAFRYGGAGTAIKATAPPPSCSKTTTAGIRPCAIHCSQPCSARTAWQGHVQRYGRILTTLSTTDPARVHESGRGPDSRGAQLPTCPPRASSCSHRTTSERGSRIRVALLLRLGSGTLGLYPPAWPVTRCSKRWGHFSPCATRRWEDRSDALATTAR